MGFEGGWSFSQMPELFSHLVSRPLSSSIYIVLSYIICCILLYSSGNEVDIHLCFFSPSLIKLLQKLMNVQEGDFIAAFRIL